MCEPAPKKSRLANLGEDGSKGLQDVMDFPAAAAVFAVATGAGPLLPAALGVYKGASDGLEAIEKAKEADEENKNALEAMLKTGLDVLATMKVRVLINPVYKFLDIISILLEMDCKYRIQTPSPTTRAQILKTSSNGCV